MAWLMNLSCVYANLMICREGYGDGISLFLSLSLYMIFGLCLAKHVCLKVLHMQLRIHGGDNVVLG